MMQSRSGRPTIGVLVGWQVYWTPSPFSYLTPIFRGIRLAAQRHGCNLLLACGMGSAGDPADQPRPAWPIPALDSDFVPVGPWNTDGLIVINPLLSEARSQFIQDLREEGHPVVFIGKGETGPTIAADNNNGVRQALQHLIAHGHREIAFIAGNPGDIEGDSGDRLRAYQAVVRQQGLAESPDLVTYGGHTFDGGYTAMQQMLAAKTQFTALMASNDESALGAMRALKEAGRQVPQDVAVIGFDDRPEAVAEVPSLTSIHVPLFRSGYQALELALDYMNGREPAPISFAIPARLVVRQSCGCRHGDALALPKVETDLSPGIAVNRAQLARAMAQTVLADSQWLDADEIWLLCQRIIEAFDISLEQRNPITFERTVEAVLRQMLLADDDMHVWHTAFSLLRHTLPTAPSAEDATYKLALDMLDGARVTIGESVRQHHSQYVFSQAWTINRIGALNARLLTALDESHIFRVLADHLPTMNVQQATIGLFERDGEDAVKWSRLHLISQGPQSEVRALTRQFPPEGLYPTNQAYSLALLPLVSQAGIVGFTAFDTSSIELLGAVTQQISAALNSARLYAEATEGRRLAEEADQIKSRFLSTVSHELRTPLSLIVGLSDILLHERNKTAHPIPDSTLRDIEQIYNSAQHLGWLIQDVLDLASSDAGQLRLTSERLNLNETLRMVVGTGQQLAAERGLGWQVSFPDTAPWVWGDRTRLRQVALNFISNAVKFTSRGEVNLKVEAKDGYAVISVSDTGVGIPLAEQSALFNEFRRTERTIARGYGGIGLGLAICKRLIELHGGELGVYSSGEEGAGSTFYFRLPLIEPETPQVEALHLPSLGQTVLLLTQELEPGERLRNRLTEQGLDSRLVHVDRAEDWLDATASLGAVVVDISMTPNRGWQVLKRLKESPAAREIPVIFYAFANERGAMLEVNYLTKPVKSLELAHLLEQQERAGSNGQRDKVLLIVDDDPSTLEMHVRIVQNQSAAYRVLRARNGREALTAMEAERPDLVLLDLMMPELDGFGVLDTMREKEALRDIPVIVLTGQVLTERDMARLNRGVATVLGKGIFSVEDTLSHIEATLLGNRRLGSEAQRNVRKAMAYLHEHFTESVTREELARHVGMSNDHLTYCFRKELGMTPVAYLNRYRINQAKLMLADGQKSVTEIALAVGFSDSGYFSRVFRREVGVSPEAFRRGK